jgi:hypothetical protein
LAIFSKRKESLKAMKEIIIRVILVFIIGLLTFCPAERLELKNDDVFVLEETNFALKELIKLSDSTIYSTLNLTNVISAHQEEGIFHDNTILVLELSSPYFRSGNPSERFEVFVMTHKEDAVKSFAIDDFPVMQVLMLQDTIITYVLKIDVKFLVLSL